MTGLTFSGGGVLQRFAGQLDELGARAPLALARALNHTGSKAKTAVIRNLVVQTGLKRSTIVRAVRTNRAAGPSGLTSYGGSLTYTLTTTGGDISLKFFGAKETKAGVSAAPRGRRQVFSGTFTKSGRFPNRRGSVSGGHVFSNIGGRAVRFEDSGVVIPDEMIQGATAAAFDQIMGDELEARIAHDIGTFLGG
nr:hypothetical protein NG677_04335 [Methylobacterium sp. OTU13CASTA1]